MNARRNLNLLQTRLSLKTRLGLYLGLTMSKKKISIFFQKMKPKPLLVQHVKGQLDSYVQKKGVSDLTLIVDTL